MVRLGDIVATLGGELIGDAETAVDRIGPLVGATATTLTYLSAPRLASALAASAAACVVVGPASGAAAAARGAAIVTPDPYLYYARLSQWWAARTRPLPASGVHPSAVVDRSAVLGQGVSVGPLAVIEADAVLGDGVVVGAQCHVGAGARLGAGTRLAAQVVVGHHCVIGARGTVHSGAVIGADGFGFAPTAAMGTGTGVDRAGSRWEKIEQFGNVTVGDDVEIGANTCIDRGSFDDTRIGDGVKLDNLIQIGHNSRIGDHTLMAGCSAAAGSADIGAHCIIGPGAGVGGHFKVASGVHVSSMAMVSHAITQPGQYGGKFPIDDQATFTKNAAALRNLHALRTRVRRLETALLGAAAAQSSPPAEATDTP